MNSKLTSVSISVIFIIFAYIHIAIPGFRFDTISLVFILMAALPWISPYLKSLQLPGGLKIELKDAKLATDKILQNMDSAGSMDSGAAPGAQNTESVGDGEGESGKIFESMAVSDPNLALVGFRIEIEKRIRLLAQKYKLSEQKSLSRIIKQLQNKNVLSKALAAGLLELVMLGNHAAHGARVSDDAADWVLKTGPSVVEILKGL